MFNDSEIQNPASNSTQPSDLSQPLQVEVSPIKEPTPKYSKQRPNQSRAVCEHGLAKECAVHRSKEYCLHSRLKRYCIECGNLSAHFRREPNLSTPQAEEQM